MTNYNLTPFLRQCYCPFSFFSLPQRNQYTIINDTLGNFCIIDSIPACGTTGALWYY